jgi:hypothetical protein
MRSSFDCVTRNASSSCAARTAAVTRAAPGSAEAHVMHDAKTYRHYAADCRRLAQTMSEKDKAVLLKMAEAWDARAQEAERVETRKKDGMGKGKPR